MHKSSALDFPGSNGNVSREAADSQSICINAYYEYVCGPPVPGEEATNPGLKLVALFDSKSTYVNPLLRWTGGQLKKP